MKKIFSIKEVKFILWFCLVFTASIILLAILGLIPSEFQTRSRETLEQKTSAALREIIDGPSTSTIKSTDTNNLDPQVQNPTVMTGNTANSQGGNSTQSTSIQGNTTSINAEDPIRLTIASINLDTIIVNPKSTNHEVLDTELTKGVVHYPGSGMPGLGNMFLFGHSTGFSVVQNPAYKVFNKLKTLKANDQIVVYGKEGVYTYAVTSVKKVDKENTLVSFDTSKNMITLSTCDSFGKKTDRYVVEGDLISIAKR